MKQTLQRLSRGLALTAALLHASMAVGASPPVSSGTAITPNGASQAATLGQIASGTRFLANRRNLALWKPRQSITSVDSGGSVFPTNKTAYLAFEVPDDFLAAQLLFGSNANTGFGVTDAAVSGSSQWGPTTYGTPGITPYDANGNALTGLSRVTFGAGGANTDPFVTQAPLNATCTTITSGSTTTALNVASTLGAAANMVVISTYANGLYLFPQTYVASVGMLVINLSQAASSIPPVGSGLCFLPIAATIPASAQPPITNWYRSDWIPVSSLARIDSPVRVGGLVQGPAGIAAGTTAVALGPTNVTISAPTTALVPQGTAVDFCQALTTTNTTTPVNTLPFASVPSTVVPGMRISQSFYPQHQFTLQQGFPSPVTVTAVSATSLTLSDFIDQSSYNGRAYFVYMPLTVAQPAANGASAVTVNAVPSNVAAGMTVIGTGVGSSNGPMNGNGTTIASLSGGNVLNLSAALNGPLAVGDTIYVGVTLTSNGTAVEPVTTFSNQQGVLPGAHITGANIKPNTYAGSVTSGQMTLSRAPSAAIPSGTTLQACDPLKTSADTPAGSTSLPFASTTYPKRLFLVRINFSTTGVVYPNNGVDQAQTNALMPGLFGEGRIESGTCGAGNDGVLSPSSIGNLTGSCSRNNQMPIAAVKFLTAKRGVVIVPVGDSHFGADTTVASSATAEMRAADAMTSPQLPVWSANCGYSGKNSFTFINDCLPLIKEVQPSVVTIAGYTFNDFGSATGASLYQSNAADLAAYVQSYGGLPVISTEYERQVYGCNSVTSAGFASIEVFRQQFEIAQVAATAANGLPLLDNAAILADPAHPNFLNPAYSTDCIHANDAGHAARATALIGLLRPYLAN